MNRCNLDDGVAVDRIKLETSITHEAEIKSGDCGTWEDKMFYTVDGGEDNYNFDVLEYFEQLGTRGFLLFRPFRAAKKLLG